MIIHRVTKLQARVWQVDRVEVGRGKREMVTLHGRVCKRHDGEVYEIFVVHYADVGETRWMPVNHATGPAVYNTFEEALVGLRVMP